jgi:hypothetical protein
VGFGVEGMKTLIIFLFLRTAISPFVSLVKKQEHKYLFVGTQLKQLP